MKSKANTLSTLIQSTWQLQWLIVIATVLFISLAGLLFAVQVVPPDDGKSIVTKKALDDLRLELSKEHGVLGEILVTRNALVALAKQVENLEKSLTDKEDALKSTDVHLAEAIVAIVETQRSQTSLVQTGTWQHPPNLTPQGVHTVPFPQPFTEEPLVFAYLEQFGVTGVTTPPFPTKTGQGPYPFVSTKCRVTSQTKDQFSFEVNTLTAADAIGARDHVLDHSVVRWVAIPRKVLPAGFGNNLTTKAKNIERQTK